MLKPIQEIIKDSVGNITYRGNVVTGEVVADNGNGSYDVYISESAEAYPRIFTLVKNPSLAVGDKVRILYENGIKELPIILPPEITGYTVTYDGNGHTGGNPPVDSNTYNSGDTVIVLGQGTLVNSGAPVFGGWCKITIWIPGCGYDLYHEDDTFLMGNENVTLYAQWWTPR